MEHTQAEMKLMTVKEVQDFLGVSRATVYNYINKNILHPYKVEGIVRFKRGEIEELFNRKK